MSGEGELDLGSADKRRTLWIVLWLNVAIALGFFAVGYFADSNALLANGLDNSSDAIVYALSLLALTRSRTWKRGAARFSGVMLLVFAGGVIADAIRRFVEGSEPGGIMMIAMAAVAAGVNLICLRLLRKMKAKDVNLRAAVRDEGGDEIDHERDPRHSDNGPAFDRLRIGKTIDGLGQQVEPDDEQRGQIDERGDDFALRIAEGHQLVGRSARDLACEPGQTERGCIAEIMQGIGDEGERTGHNPADDLRECQQDIDGHRKYQLPVAEVFLAVAVTGVPAAMIV